MNKVGGKNGICLPPVLVYGTISYRIRYISCQKYLSVVYTRDFLTFSFTI